MTTSVKTVRAATRVLQVLAALNESHPAGAAQVGRTLGMSRATTYRFLESLRDAGYAVKHESSGQYSPSFLVRALSCGFEDEDWIAQIARPVLRALGSELVWPIAIATLSGPGMLLRESTDTQSPLALHRFSAGRRIGLLDTASGRAYLAFCGRTQRETLLDVLATTAEAGVAGGFDRQAIRSELAAVRQQGYAAHRRPQRISSQCAIAVPVIANGRVLASLSIRYSESAVRSALAQQRFLGKLRQAAAQIGSSFEQAAAGRAEAPNRRLPK